MPWKEITAMSQRHEFCIFAESPDANITQLCQRFGISRKTGYKWIDRYKKQGIDGLKDRSRRPHSSPVQTDPAVEQKVVEQRSLNPAWGGRKLRTRLMNLGSGDVPAASTITQILRRKDLLDPAESKKHTAWQRFEYDEPNDLWQMDFKGHFQMHRGRCHPLTVLDDHSRFSINISACPNESGQTVKEHLISAFEVYGLPRRILADNGGPWSGGHGSQYSWFVVWLLRLGISVHHGKPYHPQTQGKEERFHRTLKAELLSYRQFADLDDCQSHFTSWRDKYNHERPHESLGMKTPASIYRPSQIAYPSTLEPVEYPLGDTVRKVQGDGCISLKGKLYQVGKAFYGYPVGIRPTLRDGLYDVYFCHQKVSAIDLTTDGSEL